MALQHYSHLTPYGYQAGSCGYCKDSNSGGSYYVNSTRLTVDHYQDLVDRGWRRSGTTLYKPDLQRSCCPHYTIRLPVDNFKTSRHHRKCLQQWNKHVLGEGYIKAAATGLPAKSREEKRAVKQNGVDLVDAVHAAEYDRLRQPPPTPDHRYTVTIESDAYTDEKFTLFEHYQRIVHHEKPKDISKGGFRRFLCNSPLARTTRTVGGVTQELGSFHQMHRLDGVLIAMSVLDILPHAVSAVYFIYLTTPASGTFAGESAAPDDFETRFETFSPGKLSALREIVLAAERGLQYYYMGYYIHSCAKMRYKAEFRPQMVLDPAGLAWDPFDGADGVGAALDRDKFVCMSWRREGTGGDGEVCFPRPSEAAARARSLFELGVPGVLTLEQLLAEVDIDAMPAKLKRESQTVMVPLSLLQAWQDGDAGDGASLKGAVAEMAAAVGPTVAKEMVVDFS